MTATIVGGDLDQITPDGQAGIFLTLAKPINPGAFGPTDATRCYPWQGGFNGFVRCGAGINSLGVSLALICPGGLNSCGIPDFIFLATGSVCPPSGNSCNDFLLIVTYLSGSGGVCEQYVLSPVSCTCQPFEINFQVPTPNTFAGVFNCTGAITGKRCASWGTIFGITIR